ncbi:MAG: acetylornithine/succinylornithine family transaminase [Pseudomonadota bacterium]
MSDLPAATHTPGPLSAELIAKGKAYYTPNYKPREMILDRGVGATVWDMDGNDYIDLGAGIAVCSLGHQDPDLLAALDAQSRKLWHTSNVFFTEPPIRLAEALVELAPFAERVFLCNSGAEANEAAIKLVRKYAADQGKPPAQRNIISFNGSFHGRTLATVTLTAQPKYHIGFEPMPGGFIYCDTFNDEAAITALVDENTCAIFVEPVQGEGGVMPAKPGFLKHLRALCDTVGALLVVDEIQAGLSRTGTVFAHTQDEIVPDVVTLAKALGGGLPIGAMLVGAKAAQTLQFGTHGTTFGGNPVMSAVALASVTKLARADILVGVASKAALLREGLAAINADLQMFSEIRGRGLMIGAELTAAYAGKSGDISELARRHGVLVLVAGPNVMRFLPPLTISDAELKTGLARLKTALQAQKASAS